MVNKVEFCLSFPDEKTAAEFADRFSVQIGCFTTKPIRMSLHAEPTWLLYVRLGVTLLTSLSNVIVPICVEYLKSKTGNRIHIKTGDDEITFTNPKELTSAVSALQQLKQ